MLCSLSSVFYLIANKLSARCLKDDITPSLRANNRLKFALDVALNHVGKKEKPQYILSYKLLNGEYGYYPLLDICTY